MKAHRIKMQNDYVYFTRETSALARAREMAKKTKAEVKIETVNLKSPQLVAALNKTLDHAKLKATTTLTVTG